MSEIKTAHDIAYRDLERKCKTLESENAELRDVIGDYRNDASRVLDEKCPSDERHCGCVPILRDQLNKYQKALILITTMPELSQATTIASENVNLSKKVTDYEKELRQSYKYDKTCSTCRYLDENRDCVLGIRCVNYTLWQGKIL